MSTTYDLQVENWALQEELEEARETIDTNFARVASQAAHIERLRQEVRAKDQLLGQVNANNEALTQNSKSLEAKVALLEEGRASTQRNNQVLTENSEKLEAKVASLSEALNLVQRGYQALREKSERLEAKNISLISALASTRRKLKDLIHGVELLKSALVPSTQKGGGFRLEVKTGYRAIENLLRAVPDQNRERLPIADSAAKYMPAGLGGSLVTEASGRSMPFDQHDKSVATDQSSMISNSIRSSAAGRHEHYDPSVLQEPQAQRCMVPGKPTATRISESAAPKEPPFSKYSATAYVQPAWDHQTEKRRAKSGSQGCIPAQGERNPMQPPIQHCRPRIPKGTPMMGRVAATTTQYTTPTADLSQDPLVERRLGDGAFEMVHRRRRRRSSCEGYDSL